MTRIVKTPLIPTEAQEQIKLVVWLQKQGIRVSASANGGSRNLFEAMKFKRMGVSAGFPDIEIPFPCGGYHGLYIEMKRLKGSVTSDAQRDWLDYLNAKGYYAAIAHGFEQAKSIVLWYLDQQILPTA